MIHGLKIHMPAADLKAHLDERFEAHRRKANDYVARLTALEGVGEEEGVSNDPVRNLRAKQEEHQRKAAFFGLLSKYLVMGETYELDTSNLAQLEMVSQWF